MRKVILAAVILQLVITLTSQYQFGDIISFKRRNCVRATYKHFAIYVGNNPNIGQNGHDLFHRTKHPREGADSDCDFGDLITEQNDATELDNYLDGIPGFEVGSVEQMAARIQEKYNNCGSYRLICNNCEHLATYIRYNETLSLQLDTTAGILLRLRYREVRRRIEATVREIREGVRAEYDCAAAANQSG